LSFDKLDFPSLAAGELTVALDDDTSGHEAVERLKHLRQMCYYVKAFDWSAVREFHGAYLGAAERSKDGNWSAIDTKELAATVLFVVPKSQAIGNSGGNRQRQVPAPGAERLRWYCIPFN